MKLLRSICYATQGIHAAYKAERNFKIHILLSALAIFLGFAFHISLVEWIAILFCMAMVTALEMMNTAIERICDLISPGKHSAIKIIKDIAAGAVLIAAFISLVTGGIIFLPKFFNFLK